MCNPLWEIFDTWKMLVNKICLPLRENLICYRDSLAEFFKRRGSIIKRENVRNVLL